MIEVVKLAKSFGGKEVLRSVSLKVNAGETMVIIGRSGCGKSVLVKHINRLLTPDSGTVLVDGIDIFSIGRNALNQFRMQIGMLFQNSALFASTFLPGAFAPVFLPSCTSGLVFVSSPFLYLLRGPYR
jgi:phospholipid/cholesterol/gamma-HCH transport system ATP-binding protein